MLAPEGRVHRRVYTDPDIFAAEMERIYGHAWLYVAHESQLEGAGAFVTAHMGDRPVIVARHTDDEIHVFANRCTHRGMKVCSARRGSKKRFVCPYHGWAFSTDGSLIGIPHGKGYNGKLDPKDPALGLDRAPRVESYRGFVFASRAADGPSLADYLGPPRFRPERPSRGTGVVTGLAWTTMGGATLDVEATTVHEDGSSFRLTGQLGDVMKESAQIAYSYVMANLETLEGPTGFFKDRSVHVHVPEGATPKDGPSAGVTMATALLSLAKGKQLARKLAMTGELTLTGRVLPVGGIREKVIAARRIGVPELILPEDNRRDFEELPDYLKEGLTVHFASEYCDVAAVAFTKASAVKKSRRKKK